jgi:hypothetical protein
MSPTVGSPATHRVYNFNRDEFRYQVQLGSQLYPNTAIRSHAESYYHLQKCVGELTTGVGVSTGPTYRSDQLPPRHRLREGSQHTGGPGGFLAASTPKMSGEQMRLFFEKVTPCIVTAGDADKRCDWSPI